MPNLDLFGRPAVPEGSAEPAEPRAFRDLPEMIRDAAEPLAEIDDPLFAIAFDRFADARVVLLGEASHGTSEFYRARAAITRRLIEEHGFNIVAVEADWPDAALIDRHVRHQPRRKDAEPGFQRFPTWMWRNTDVRAFTQWLYDHNSFKAPSERAGFYGLDLYNLSDSMVAVVSYLDKIDPDAAQLARQRYGCLTPWAREPQMYGRMAITEGYSACEAGVAAMLKELLARRLDYMAQDGGDFLDAAGSARLVRDAEAYYRVMYYGSAASWNLRDTHMFETLESLLAHHGEGARAVVWAHNSHIGDARFTEMGTSRDELNIGQLCRQRWGDQARLIGFGTHTGTVAAADDWDWPMEVKRVNPSRPDSYEYACHEAGLPRFLLDLREGARPEARHALTPPRLERFIGVIYRPDTERWSHYSECSLARQYDAFVWFDETTAVTPLPGPSEAGAEETWPFGL
jgi:erythromycin esterase-like protein